MALESERSEDYSTQRGLAALKGAATEAAGHLRASLATAGRRAAKSIRSAIDAAARLGAAVAARLRPQSDAAMQRASAVGSTVSSTFTPIAHWFKRQPLVRFISATLLRRILASNLIGFAILVGGILYLGWVNTWLIDAKVDALKTQGKIIADSIAANAKVIRERIILDPDELPEASASSRRYPDDGLEALELSIHPEEVTPILRRLIKPTDTRARIYARDGTLIVDTARSLASLTAKLEESASSAPEEAKPQNFWTRFTRYLFKEPLPVYREIDAGNGTAYPEVRDALRGNERSMLLLNKKGEQIVSMAVPIMRFHNVQGVLLLSTRPGQIDRILREERIVILTLSAMALFALIVTSLLLARTVAGPMRRLSAAAEQASHDIGARARLPELADRSDEVGQMAGAFQAMTEALYRRIEASERFAADVAHELKNPLTAARSTAESLSFAKTDAERDHLVQQIKDELKRLNRLITDVSNASRLDAELARKEMRSVDVPTMLRNVVGIFRDILGDDSRRLVLAVGREPFEGAFFIVGDEGRLGQVVTNLIDNAVSFSPEGGTVTVRARADGRCVEILVEDEGPGIPEDRLTVIFDRFYSDRPATDQSRGKNSGLGLSISREIVRAHGGEIVAENRYAEGATQGAKPIGARFIVRLPIAERTQRGGAPVGRRG
ncbi:MAG TPA: stimulus-sensing domain-containing protein [Hyphomicrobium sp.]|jgi:two-component system sensor histidine kinase ChvG